MTKIGYSNEYYQASEKLLLKINSFRDFDILKDYFCRKCLFTIIFELGYKKYMEEFLIKFGIEININRFDYFFSKKEMFEMILSNLNIEYNYKQIFIVKYNLRYLETTKEILDIKIIQGDENYLTSYIESRIEDKYIGYFLICTIYSLFETLPKMKIRGGFIRDMFDNKYHNKNIDIDIYIDNLDIILMNVTLNVKNMKEYLEFKIDAIINSLANIIFKNSIELDNIFKYKISTYKIKSLYCISLKYKIKDFTITFDINHNGSYEFCRNIITSKYNIDFEQNGLELRYKDSKLICKMYRKYKNTTSYIKNELTRKYNSIKIINKYITNEKLNNNLDIIRIIRDFIGIEYMYMLKIINTIINKEMYPTHNLCCNTKPRCIYNNNLVCKCSVCHEIYKKIYNRYNKFSNRYNVHCNRCNNILCIYQGIINNNLIQDSDSSSE